VTTASDNSYTKTYVIEATGEQVYRALTDPQSISSWWNTTSTTGSGQAGGELRTMFGAEQEPTVRRVIAAHRHSVVIWEVAASPLVPDWVGTRPTFTISALSNGCRLDFAHHGLVPDLDCFDKCARDWGGFLTRIRDFAQGQ
jgi:hypothetical protein